MTLLKTKRSFFTCFCIFIATLALLTGCNTKNIKSTKAYTFNVDNGDEIKVLLDTTGDYDLSSELPFTISCDGNIISQGSFIEAEAYQQYINVVNNDSKARLLDAGEKDGVEYIFWCYNESEYNYAVLINDSKTGVIIGNIVSEESAKECFDRLTFSCEN